jgi:hypothetical protein
MEHLESWVIGHIFKLLAKIENFYVIARENLCRLFEESEFYSWKSIQSKLVSRMQHLNQLQASAICIIVNNTEIHLWVK